MTQLSEISESTALGCIDEFATKYPKGTRIADTPRNRQLGIAGSKLDGTMILQEPPQSGAISAHILKHARSRDIHIVDVNGTDYRPPVRTMTRSDVTYLYGWKWHSSGRFPIDEMTEEQARGAWEKGPQLGVAAGEDLDRGKVPEYSLEMNAGAQDVDSYHYDEPGSVVASLGWQTIDGRLFLADVAEWLYPDDGRFHEMDECLAYRSYYFKPDGYARLRSDVKAAGGVTIEEFSGVDVSDHWLDPLEWGDWDRIGRHRPSTPAAS